MNKTERIKAALAFQEVDHIPSSIWMHFSEFDQDPRALAEEQVSFTRKYDYDFIKLMPFGTYSIQDWGARIKIYCDKYKEPIVEAPGINTLADYHALEVFPAYHGTWGKQVEYAAHVAKLLNGEMPFIQTIFSPLTTLRKLAGERLKTDIAENPKEIHHALQIITETTINFIKANINLGVSGFFFATQCATYDYMNDSQHSEFGATYDKMVINAYKDKTYFNVIHIHGENIMFDVINNEYDCNCLNWHDRHVEPGFSAARAKSTKCFLGGINEVPYFVNGVLQYNSFLQRSNPEQLRVHMNEAISAAGKRGLIIGPGCVVDPRTSEENLMTVSKTVKNIGFFNGRGFVIDKWFP